MRNGTGHGTAESADRCAARWRDPCRATSGNNSLDQRVCDDLSVEQVSRLTRPFSARPIGTARICRTIRSGRIRANSPLPPPCRGLRRKRSVPRRAPVVGLSARNKFSSSSRSRMSSSVRVWIESAAPNECLPRFVVRVIARQTGSGS